MSVILSLAAVFAVGSSLYGATELLFRGWTHWTMLILGGVCFVGMYLIKTLMAISEWRRWILGGACITAAEFVTGVIVNIKLGWGIWDYSGHFLNFHGQICPLFSLFWALLSIPGMRICGSLHSLLSRREQ